LNLQSKALTGQHFFYIQEEAFTHFNRYSCEVATFLLSQPFSFCYLYGANW